MFFFKRMKVTWETNVADMNDFNFTLGKMRQYFESGSTLAYPFRKKQLNRLLETILTYEEAINAALYADLKKSKEETWATETGLVIHEIKGALHHLKKWMRPQSVPAGLVTFPSSAKIYKDPLGVVLIIAPWNYPLQLILIPLAGAIAAGNCVVVKPSELAPATEKILIKIIEESFDENYVKVITGNGADVIPVMMQQFKFNHIFYTGSTLVGKAIYKLAADDLVPVTLELGGKSPCIVYDDAAIKVAAKRIILGKFLNAGQTCVAPDYVLVQQHVKTQLLEALKVAIQEFYTDDPAASRDYGKIINEKRFHKLVSYLKPERLFYGGKYDQANLYIAPTLITNLSLDDDLMREEIFGPILPVLSFGTTQEAFQVVRRNENPLALYLFTKNKKVEEEWIKNIPFGGGCINNTVWQFANEHFPFGGIGNSGWGAYHGKHSFNQFTHLKPVLKSATAIDPALKYPPFKGKMKWFKKLIG